MSNYSRTLKIEVSQRNLYERISSRYLAREYNLSSSLVRYWSAVYRLHGDKAFLREGPVEPPERLHILKKMWTEGWSMFHTSAVFDLPTPGTLQAWSSYYERFGAEGFLVNKQGLNVKKKENLPIAGKNPKEMSAQELQEELEYLRAENAVLKKYKAFLQPSPSPTKKKRK